MAVLTVTRTTIGQKVLMAVTGLIWIGFLVLHMYGNLKAFGGAAAFNSYAQQLRTIGEPILGDRYFLTLLRVVTMVALITHILLAVRLSARNYVSRGNNRYAARKSVQADAAALTMKWGGLAIAFFVLFHLMQFTWGVKAVLPAFVRGDAFALQRDGAQLVGTETPRVAVSEGGVSFAGGAVLDAPWIAFAIVWVVALAVLLVRQRAPERAAWVPALWAGAFVAGLLLFDHFVLQVRFGAGALAEARHQASPGIILSLLAFEAILFAACYLALALPGRLLIGRVLPPRLRLVGEIAWALLWALLPTLFPAAFFSLGYDLARI